ncbi:hypothetical protein A167_02607 [Alcanivorax sp. S71-1-4]|uniref:flagellar hook-length control protein FliK n=1 Tax=Alcanivorax sp. S71-1-4 TaxID=1177159 RepID=UPI00135B7E3F|nr:flagellar hook-length control protein FliK [Alcanivorax sp. S71-1-4]KAF0808642.1 hypothetical protein A167_02607 [Alcanivorax sp. S71-1-4]
MSGITPILDTLLHQVLGRRVDVPWTQALNAPVRPLHPAGALPALRSDSRLDPRAPPLTDLARSPAQAAPQGAPSSPADTAVSARTHFSVAANAIADVLARFPAPPSAIRPAAPLLSTPPLSASLAQGEPVATLAQQLRASIEHSGLFYQSHLARWHRGELPLTVLAREPQMQLTRPVLTQRVLQGERTEPFQRTTTPAISLLAPDKKNHFTDSAMPASARDGVAEPPLHKTAAGVTTINETLQALVRHQLEVLAMPVVHWQGDVWTGLFMSLSLTWLPSLPEDTPAREGEQETPQRAPDEPEARRWQLSLTLSHGQLGLLHGSLQLARGQLLVTVQCERDDVTRLLLENRQSLCRRLEAAGFDAVQLQIKNAEREPAGDER